MQRKLVQVGEEYVKSSSRSYYNIDRVKVVDLGPFKPAGRRYGSTDPAPSDVIDGEEFAGVVRGEGDLVAVRSIPDPETQYRTHTNRVKLVKCRELQDTWEGYLAFRAEQRDTTDRAKREADARRETAHALEVRAQAHGVKVAFDFGDRDARLSAADLARLLDLADASQ